MTQNHSTNKTIAKNTLYLYIRMILVMGVSLYTSRIILEVLGVEDYGLYSVVGGIVVLFSFIQNALVSALQRFLNVEIGKQNIAEASTIFNTSIYVYGLVCLAIIILAETIGLWYINSEYLNIPDGSHDAVFWVYQLTIITTIFSILQTPYTAVIIAHERMSFYAYISIIDVGLKLAILYILKFLIFGFQEVVVYAFLILAVTIIIFLITKIYVNIKFTLSRFHWEFNKNHFKGLISFSGWSLMGQMGVVAINQGTALILNFFYGVVINTSFGIANQVAAALNRFVGSFQTAFTPNLMKSYAKKDYLYLRKMVLNSAKYSFLLMLIPAIPLLIETKFLLTVWLKETPEYIVQFVQLTILYMLVDTLSGPYLSVVYASGRLKKYQITITFFLFINIILVFLVLWGGMTAPASLLIRVIISLITLYYRIKFVEKLIGLKPKDFFRQTAIPVSFVIVSSIIIPIALYLCLSEGLVRLILVSSTAFICTIISIYYIGISEKERNFVKAKIKKSL